jgi:hypothetical protein
MGEPHAKPGNVRKTSPTQFSIPGKLFAKSAELSRPLLSKVLIQIESRKPMNNLKPLIK